MKYRDLISSFFWIAVGGIFCIGSLNYGFSRMGTIGGGFFPFVAGIVLLSLSMVVLITALATKKKNEPVKEKFLPERDSLRKLLLGFVALFTYVLVVKYFGFVLTTLIFMIFLLRFIEPQRWIVVFTAAIATSAIAYFIFNLWLNVQLPRGILGI